MPVLQLLGSTTIYLIHARSGDFRPEAAFAAYLGFVALAAAAFASPKPLFRIPLIALKCAFCLALGRLDPSPLLLLPAIFLEAPELFPPQRRFLPLWAFLGILGAAPLVILPRTRLAESFPALFLSYSACASIAARSLVLRARQARLESRARELERGLTEAEARRAALERGRTGADGLARAQERERIAARLHDDLGHAMTGSIMQLEAASLLYDDDAQRSRRIVADVTQTLRQGLASVRSSLRAIKPSPAELGIERLEAALAAFEAEQGINASLSAEGPLAAMPQRIWLAVEANLREALTNVLRHSSGRSFRCRMQALNGAYRIEFRDDGTPSPSFRKGMGLEGMEARTREAGGTLIVDAGRGFSVIMLFLKGGD